MSVGTNRVCHYHIIKVFRSFEGIALIFESIRVLSAYYWFYFPFQFFHFWFPKGEGARGVFVMDMTI